MTTPTDTSEKGLEDLIVRSLVEEAGYEQGSNADYDRARALDTAKLLRLRRSGRTRRGARGRSSWTACRRKWRGAAWWTSCARA